MVVIKKKKKGVESSFSNEYKSFQYDYNWLFADPIEVIYLITVFIALKYMFMGNKELMSSYFFSFSNFHFETF